MSDKKNAGAGWLVRLCLGYAGRESGSAQRLALLAAAAVVVVLVIPSIVLYAGLSIDERLGLPAAGFWLVNRLIAAALVCFGLYVTVWAVWVMHSAGEGTPNPLIPTKRLVTTGPFAYSRNPLSPSVALYVIGVSLWFGSPGGAILTIIPIGLILLYVKLVEEKELEIRFGEDYLAYKKRTPFLIPRPPARL